MKNIWKYELSMVNAQCILMQEGAEILSVANQCGTICLWALVEETAAQEGVNFYIYGTGNGCQPQGNRFLGTVQMSPFVWHVFTDKKEAIADD